MACDAPASPTLSRSIRTGKPRLSVQEDASPCCAAEGTANPLVPLNGMFTPPDCIVSTAIFSRNSRKLRRSLLEMVPTNGELKKGDLVGQAVLKMRRRSDDERSLRSSSHARRSSLLP